MFPQQQIQYPLCLVSNRSIPVNVAIATNHIISTVDTKASVFYFISLNT